MEHIRKVQELLGSWELDAILLTDDKNRRWCTGLNASDGTVLVTRREAFCFVDSRYIEIAQATVKDAVVGMTSQEMPGSPTPWPTAGCSAWALRRRPCPTAPISALPA